MKSHGNGAHGFYQIKRPWASAPMAAPGPSRDPWSRVPATKAKIKPSEFSFHYSPQPCLGFLFYHIFPLLVKQNFIPCSGRIICQELFRTPLTDRISSKVTKTKESRTPRLLTSILEVLPDIFSSSPPQHVHTPPSSPGSRKVFSPLT